jgi:hypothetical protein
MNSKCSVSPRGHPPCMQPQPAYEYDCTACTCTAVGRHAYCRTRPLQLHGGCPKLPCLASSSRPTSTVMARTVRLLGLPLLCCVVGLFGAAASGGVGGCAAPGEERKEELESLRLSVLLQRAHAAGVPSDALTAAQDAAQPKVAIARLLTAKCELGGGAHKKKAKQKKQQKQDTKSKSSSRRRSGSRKYDSTQPSPPRDHSRDLPKSRPTTFIARLRELGAHMPTLETVSKSVAGVMMVLTALSVWTLKKEIALAPTKEEFGAPKDENGQVIKIPGRGKGKGKPPQGRGGKQVSPLLGQLRRRAELHLGGHEPQPGSAGADLRHHTAPSAKAFKGETKRSVQLSIANIKAVTAVIDRRRQRKRCWFGHDCYRRSVEHRAAYAHPHDKDWVLAGVTGGQRRGPLQILLAGPTPDALHSCNAHWQRCGGGGAGGGAEEAVVSDTICFIAEHTGLLHQFMKQVLAKVQKFIHLSPVRRHHHTA